MKKIIAIISILVTLTATVAYTTLAVKAHPGGTDGSGGHTNHSTGEYHYHHGYSAHDHYDMDGDGVVDCPYEFDDRTNHSDSRTTSSVQTAEPTSTPTEAASIESNSKTNTAFRSVLSWIIAFGVYVFIMFVLPFLIKR